MSSRRRSSRVYDAIVVGAGHNGLICAAYLARAGLRVVVLESRPAVGGAATTQEVWPGYRVSVLSYVVSLLRPVVVRELGLARLGYRVHALDPAYFMPFPDGRGLYYWEEVHRAAAEVAKFSAHDAQALLDYDRTLGRLVGLVRPLLDRAPPRLARPGPGDLVSALGLGAVLARHRRDLSQLADILTMSVSDFLGQWFDDPSIKGALAPGGVIGAWAGPHHPGTAYVLLHHRIGEAGGQRGGWGFVEGGMGALADIVATAARRQGAEIRTGARVARIIVAQGKARGVALDDGTELRSERVISAVHPRTALLELVGAEHLPPAVTRDLERFRSRSGSAKVNLALAELPDFSAAPGKQPGPQHPEFIINPSIDYLEAAWQDGLAGRWSRSPMLDCVIPTTKDPALAPPGRHILSCFVQYAPIQLAQGGWEQERDRLADRVIEVLGSYAPNLPSAVIHRQVVTPEDMERDYGLLGGNIFHGEMSLDQLFSLRPTPSLAAYRTPLRGLYLGGSGSHPGGGVMGAPGRNCALAVIRDWRWQRWRRREAPV
ncbi:MAG: phytoene desaturase family protein [Candidatus Dormibacteria bacterium]